MMEGDGVLSTHQGKDVHFDCKANGDAPISIMWRREGREFLAEPGKSSITVIRELQHVTSRISIKKTQKSDSGRYECQASNPFGKSYYHIHLQIWGNAVNLYEYCVIHFFLLYRASKFTRKPYNCKCYLPNSTNILVHFTSGTKNLEICGSMEKAA